jgi:Uma2 family endonuclease
MDTMIVLKDKFTAGLSDEEFFRFCQENHDLRIERNSKMEIVIMSPVGAEFSLYNGEISRQLSNWNAEHAYGVCFDSSAGFTLPDQSVMSPDCAWISKERWRALPVQDRSRFAHICPDFVIEVRSKSDVLRDVQAKMRRWIENGAQLAWLIDPLLRNSTVFYEDGRVEKFPGFDRKLIGSAPVSGFELDLTRLLTLE